MGHPGTKGKVTIKKFSYKSRYTASLFKKEIVEPEKKKNRRAMCKRGRGHINMKTKIKSGQRFEMFISVLLPLDFKRYFEQRVFIKILIKDKDSRYKFAVPDYPSCTYRKTGVGIEIVT
jgi:hypothetical protein